jgi:uncharacterized protein DUF5667/uncharacterized protein DUF5666
MSENLYDALEICLHSLEQGEDIEVCLARFPQLADDLRPLLQTAAQLHDSAATSVPMVIMLSGRSRLLDHAAELREQATVKKARPLFGALFGRSFSKAFIALLLLVVFILSGTGLVSASNAALPGDQLYPVKRTWEDLRLQFAFTPQGRETLENEFEQERVDEVNTLVTHGRVEKVSFIGLISGIFPDHLIVSGINVIIDAHTQLPGLFSLNQLVQVDGETQSGGAVLAKKIVFVQQGEGGEDNGGNGKGNGGDNSGGNLGHGSSESKTPEPKETLEPQNTPEPLSTHGDGNDNHGSTAEPTSGFDSRQEFKLEGVVQQMDQNIWTVNNLKILVDPARAEVQGHIVVGAFVSIEGYVDINGTLVAKRVELRSSTASQTPAPTSGSSSGSDNGGGGGGTGVTPTDDHGGGG